MDINAILMLIVYILIVVGIIQLVRLAFADADLTLLWKVRFGKKPEEVLYKKVVWITGASSGIGEFLAYELSRWGAKLVLSARRKEQLERVKQQCIERCCTTDAEDIMVLPLDLKDTESHQKAADAVMNKFGKIDVLVNNGGQSQRAWAIDAPIETVRQLMELNFIGTVSLTQAVLPFMVERKQGHIVVMSSVTGKIGTIHSSSYSASKHALQGYFDTLRVEMVENNIDVTLVCPGPVESEVVINAATDKVGEKHNVDRSSAEKRMSTPRCTELVAFAMANKLNEVWIALNPWLAFMYVSQYTPDISKWLMKSAGVNYVRKMRGT